MIEKILKAARVIASATTETVGVRVTRDDDGERLAIITMSDREADAFFEMVASVQDYFSDTRSDAHCSACGAPMTWVKTASGKKAPLDSVSIDGLDAEGNHHKIRLAHHATCPKWKS